MADEPRPTFESVAVQNGLATAEQVRECQAVQAEAQARGEPPPALERLLLEKGHMTAEKIHAVRTALARLQRDQQRTEQPLRIGNYEIIGKIGDGGLGTVYRARQLSMSRDVALKVLHKKWLTDEEFKKRFLLEARLAGKLSHQNLIQVYDVGRDRGVYFFAMEFVDGETAESLIERQGPLEIAHAVDITVQILRAVQYIQSRGLVHRDIKPGNIMLSRSGVAKLGDFGFVWSKLDKMIATQGEVLGTPDYISPEQAMGLETVDWRSDQYSLGCTLYHMLTCKPPFEGTQSAVMRQHIKAQLPDPRTYNPKLTDAAVQVLERMLAKDPGDRYQHTVELFQDLELVKLGQDPATDRLDTGKSTIMRAYRLERDKVERTSGELQTLREELSATRRYMFYAFGLAGVLAIALVVVLIWTVLKGP